MGTRASNLRAEGCYGSISGNVCLHPSSSHHKSGASASRRMRNLKVGGGKIIFSESGDRRELALMEGDCGHTLRTLRTTLRGRGHQHSTLHKTMLRLKEMVWLTKGPTWFSQQMAELRFGDRSEIRRPFPRPRCLHQVLLTMSQRCPVKSVPRGLAGSGSRQLHSHLAPHSKASSA